MEFINNFWNQWLALPLDPLKKYTGIDWTQGWSALVYKLVVILVLLIILFEVFVRVKRLVMRRFKKDKDPWAQPEASFRRPSDTRLIEEIEAAKDFEGTVASLKKAKQYDRVAGIYSSHNQPGEAAKWFEKAGDRKAAASEWAKAGYTHKAAKMLLKEGDYGAAAQFFEADNRLLDAAAAYLRLGDLPRAAEVFGKAGKTDEAARVYAEYFESSDDPPEVQLRAADKCFALIESETGLPSETRQALLPALAARFEQGRVELAAKLYYEGGMPDKAAGIYARLGKMREAAKCYYEAGNTREASLIGARFLETAQRWAEAADAYVEAGEFLRAGDCFGKANQPSRAAGCYERAGEFYGAGLAYSHLHKYEDAVRMLQRVKETDTKFDVSRALLGRCFYELDDYEHCAAALEVYLAGKRVESGNADYFYMLALACEQLGQLDKSRELLCKIQSVNANFKDVAQRISSISSRLSIETGKKP